MSSTFTRTLAALAAEHGDTDAWQAGAEWYPQAWREARRIARLAPAGIGPIRAAGIIAALSPRSRWSENLRQAEAIARAASRGDRDPPAVGLGDARRKAWRIAHGEHPSDVLGGVKVRAFWRNICGDADAVTVDVWAARAAGADPARLTDAILADLRAAYTAAARAAGMSPRDFQAAAWIAVRGGAS